MAGDPKPKSAAAKPTARSSPVLVPQGVLQGQPDVPLDRPVTTVGSNDNARLHLVSRTVSKGHAIFVNSGGVTYVADLASRTGVLVNGKLIRDVDLKNGDRVQIGKFVFRYRSPPNLAPPPPATMVPPAAIIVVGSPAKSITRRVFQIGRRDNGDVVLPTDAGVSASHAVVFEMDGRWYVRDLGSRTGTTVNGKAIHQQVLSFGDRMVIGSSTILFQPGVAEADETAQTAPEPAPDESFEFAPQPVERAERITAERISAETPLASAADDEIPLADDLPAHGRDWKSAFPAPIPESETIAVDSEAIPLQELSEPGIETPAAEPLGSVLSEHAAIPEQVEIEPAVDVPIEIDEPQPIAVERESATVAEVHHEVEIPPEAVEPSAIEPDPFAVEEEAAPVAEAHYEIEIPIEAIEPEAIEPDAFAVEEKPALVAQVHHEIEIPIEAVEPVVIEPEPVAVEEQAAPVAEVRQPVEISGESEISAVGEEGVQPAAPTMGSEIADGIASPAAAAEPNGSAAGGVANSLPIPVPVDFVDPVEDFVFVPGAEVADSSGLPDVIFWGDPDLDFAAEQSAVAPVPAETPAAEEKPPVPPAPAIAAVPPAPMKELVSTDVAGEPIEELSTSVELEAAGDITPPPPTELVTEDLSVDSVEVTAPVATGEIAAHHKVDLATASVSHTPLPEAGPSEVTFGSVKELEPFIHAVVTGVSTAVVEHTAVAPVVGLAAMAIATDVVHSPLPELGETEIEFESATVSSPAVSEMGGTAAVEFADPIVHTPNTEFAPADISSDSVKEPVTPAGPVVEEIDSTTAVEFAEATSPASPAEIALDAVEPPVTPTTDSIRQAVTESVDEIAPEPSAESADASIDFLDEAEPTPIAESDEIVSAPELPAEVSESEPAVEALAPTLLASAESAEPAPPSTDNLVDSVVDELPPGPVIDAGADVTPLMADDSTDQVDPESNLNFADTATGDPPVAAVDQDIAPVIGDHLSADAADDQPSDPLSDSFPLIESASELPWPKDLAAFAKATAATAGIYGATVLPTVSIPTISISTGSADTTAEPIETFIDVVPMPESSHSAHDVEEIEFLEPEEHAPPGISEPDVSEISAVSTVAEIPADDHVTVTEPIALESAPATEPDHEIPSAEIAPAEPDVDELDFGDHDDALEAPSGFAEIHTDDEPSTGGVGDISGISTVDETSPADRTTLTQPQTPVAETNESELDFSDAKPAPATPPAAAPDTGGARHGPSIFGIQFEGGSFLGGMPISLTGRTPSLAPSKPGAPVFDARTRPPSGLSDAIGAPIPLTPPKILPRPSTPPRPAINQPVVPAAPSSLSGLIGEAHAPWAAAPVIPPVNRESTPAQKPAGGARRALTSNFTVPGSAPRNAEVFSQMAAPIGVEVFGGRPGDPNQFTVPESKETAALKAAADAEEAAAAAKAAPAVSLPAKKARRSRVPWLVVLAVAVCGGLVGAVYQFVPVSSQVVGSITFDGLRSQEAGDGHAFREDQAKIRLPSDEVRQTALAILDAKGVSPGFLSDEETYAESVGYNNLNWDKDTLQFILNTTNEPVGTAQVKAVMTALAQRDRDLDAAKNTARADAAAAKAAVDDSAAKVESITQQRREQEDKAQDRPDASIVTMADQDAARLQMDYTNAKTIRENSEKALADIRSEDPAKPIDIDSDPQVIDLKKQLQPLLDQIAKLRGAGAIDAGSKAVIGTDVTVAATTQPDSNADPLLVPLQQQADALSAKLNQRRMDLAAAEAVSPEQRAVNLAHEVEDLSVKITTLTKVEADAKAAYDTAAAKAADIHARVSAAHLADIKVDELRTMQIDTEAEHLRARNTQDEKEAVLGRCVTLTGNPTVDTRSRTDMRPKLAIGGSIGALLFFGLMIAGELRRPGLMKKGETPAAAPLVSPPARTIPWPQPRDLQGLENGGVEPAPVESEHEQVFGV